MRDQFATPCGARVRHDSEEPREGQGQEVVANELRRRIGGLVLEKNLRFDNQPIVFSNAPLTFDSCACDAIPQVCQDAEQHGRILNVVEREAGAEKGVTITGL